jgi:hypothetical protein
MQPTDVQVERSLAALRAAGVPDPAPAGVVADRAGDGELPDGLLERISALPSVRLDRLDEAKTLLDAGSYPDADLLAQKILGRIVCDRLR